MKNIRFTFLAALVAILFAQCTTEETIDLGSQLSAPTNVSAIIDIATDDSGTVTVTPSADAANMFNVYFGDTTDETPTEVANGQSTAHVYAEGVYTLRVVAIGQTGLTSEFNQVVNVSFTVPSNVGAEVMISPTNPFEVTITPTGDDVTVYEVYPGEDPNEAPILVMAGDSYTHTYTTPGTYTVTVVAKGASSETVTYTYEVIVLGATDPITLPITFESSSVNYAFVAFGNVGSGVIDNPDASGMNTSPKVATTNKPGGAETWGGSFMQLVDPIDFSMNTTFKVLVWSPKAGAVVRLKVENADDGNLFHEVDATTTVANEWEELTFDFSAINMANTYHKIVLFFDFGVAGDDSNYYFDNIRLEAGGSTGGGGGTCTDLETFEAAIGSIAFTDFGNAFSTMVANPDMSGMNTTGQVIQLEKTAGAETWAGGFFETAAPLDFASNPFVKVKVWSPKVGAVVKLKVENLADGNINAEVDQVTTVANQWEELTYDFSAIDLANTYQRVVMFFDFGNAGDGTTYYYDEIQMCDSATTGGGGGGGPTMVSIIDFEDAIGSYAYTDFGNAFASTIANPDMSGNTSAQVTQVEKTTGSETWAGNFVELASPIDFANYGKIKVKVWSPKVGAVVKIKVENLADGNINAEVDQVTTVANQWEELTYDFSAIDTSNDYGRLVFFFDFGNAGDGSFYYIDEFVSAQ